MAGAAMDAVRAESCVPPAVSALAPMLDAAPRWHVLAAGKAAEPMLRVAWSCLDRRPATAVCVAPALPTDPLPGVEWFVGGHPVPTEGSVAAGARARAQAEACGPNEVWLVLLSGGASALLAAPAGGLSLADKQDTTRRLLRGGADIYALNTVRKHLSQTKGGRLAAACPGRTCCLAISDVVGDDLSVIASGPTVADASTFADALAVLDRVGGRSAFAPAVVAWLEHGAATGLGESPKPGGAALARATTRVIAGQGDALRGAAARARDLGYAVVVCPEPIVGEARTAAAAYAARVAAARGAVGGRAVCLLSAGETTVTVRGDGRGGRNQEFALASFDWLASLTDGAVLASVGTDGIDGPTDAAGALADTSSRERARDAGLEPPEAVLARNDAYGFFAALGDLIVTGPSGTNVGDVQVVVMAGAAR